ncbi:AAA family ATPase [Rhodococcus fascians]|nr:AAA family ATPase [Rhodococcus fascians]MBY4430538.1 AAA family ATPase [Rhodococcus fascians]
MTDIDLLSLNISNFRSIHGSVQIPLDSSIVLIHGTNGTGKTSILSAIELALTGTVESLQRHDESFVENLIHRSESQADIALEVEIDGAERYVHKVRVDSEGIRTNQLLDRKLSRFFSERCYLAQATLGRLLEIYQRPERRGAESPLTLFIKEVLGLDRLDALVDGLHSVGHLSRVRTLIPEYQALESDSKSKASVTKALQDRISEAIEVETMLRLRIESEFLSDEREFFQQASEPASLRSGLESRLRDINSMVQSLEVLSDRLTSIPNESIISLASAESNAVRAQAKLQEWFENWGNSMDAILEELQVAFPGLPSVTAGGPLAAFDAAMSRLVEEQSFLKREVTRNSGRQEAWNEISGELKRAQARLGRIEDQLLTDAVDHTGLATILSSLVPHLDASNICPVCVRDYSEVKDVPLKDDLVVRVAALSESAKRLSELVRARTEMAGMIEKLKLREIDLRGQLLSVVSRDELAMQVGRLADWVNRLGRLKSGVEKGDSVWRKNLDAANTLSEIRNTAVDSADIRRRVDHAATELHVAHLVVNESSASALHRLKVVAEGQIEKTVNQIARLDLYSTLIKDLRKSVLYRESLKVDLAQSISTSEQLRATLKSFATSRSKLKLLAEAANSDRSRIIAEVFNDRLNSIWRDLFTRLAPSEPFVPAFNVPGGTAKKLTAQLQTVHQDGGLGGTPGAVLSSGNLNTAALTLFLALHLSVSKDLPILVLDDPVQSMDEVHISQFAALLRSISREHGRKIVLAVHERSLFEYLRLELSPASIGEKLINIELSRSDNGRGSLATPTIDYWREDLSLSTG